MSQKGGVIERENHDRKNLFGSIKTKSLLRVAVLYFTYFFGNETGPREAIKQRLRAKGIPLRDNTITFELKPSDVVPLIHCSEKIAQEYIDLLKILMM
jgi:hypothetical protein